MKQRLQEFISEFTNFFPIKLILLHLKKNQILLFFWLFMFLTITENFGSKMGIPYLFLDPEYQHETNFASMSIMGIAFSIFCISFFITSYILDSHRFAFLGTIKFPFMHFCINNGFLPLLFISIYIPKFVIFQIQNGFESYGEIILEATGFLLGATITTLTFFLYFSLTNKDLFKHIASNLDTQLRKKKINAVRVIKKLTDAKKKRYSVSSFLDWRLRFKKVNHDIHFDRKDLLKVIDQHHLNAVSVEILVFITIIVIGLFRDNPSFQLPAAASVLLFFSFVMMFTGAFSYWLRGWAITGMILLFLLFNQLVKTGVIISNYEAFGLNYETEKVNYSKKVISNINSPDNYRSDSLEMISVLNTWRAKFPENEPPKMVFLTSSGGGQRAAVWTVKTLQHIDSTFDGDLLKHTVMMSGASGGLIGLSYYRELLLQKHLHNIPSVYHQKYADYMAKDILNPIIFSLVVSDFFLRFQKFELDGKKYYKGRGYAFERQLIKNTEGYLDRSVMEYRPYEKAATIPMLLLAPTIIKDGRKLFISPLNMSFLCNYPPSVRERLVARDRGVELMRLFEHQDAKDLRFTSALRMNATFPYITPNVHLPTTPTVEIMDAGLTDNFGIVDAIYFCYTFQKWIEKNTAGIVIISIRDNEKNPEMSPYEDRSIANKFINPIDGILSTLESRQDFTNDNLIFEANETFNNKLDYIPICYDPKPRNWDKLRKTNISMEKVEEEMERERARLSWHLTTREKESLYRTVKEDSNQQAIERLATLLGKEIN